MNYQKTIDRFYNEYKNRERILLEELGNILGEDIIEAQKHYIYDDRIKFYYKTKKRKSTLINDALQIDQYIDEFGEYVANHNDSKLKDLYAIYTKLEKLGNEFRDKCNQYVESLRERARNIWYEIEELAKKLKGKDNIELGYVSLNSDNVCIKIVEKLDVKFGDKESVEFITIYNNEEDADRLEIGKRIYELEKERREINDFLEDWDGED